MLRDLRALPKAHLHLHVTGSVRRSTAAELGGPTTFPDRYATWDEFVATYRGVKAVFRRPDDLHRVVVELVRDSAADGAVWTEVGLSPSGSHRRLTGSDDATMELVCDAVAIAGGAGVVVGNDRGRDAADPTAMAELAARWAERGVVGLGLTGDETVPSAPFARASDIARDAGLLVVPHVGELCGPDRIREDLATLRPDRLMHGVRVAEDPALVAELAERGIALDVCPTSNVALGVVPDPASHPLPALLEAGVGCSLNADDTLVFTTSLAGEYRLARERLGLDDAALAGIARTSLVASAAPAAVVERGLAGIDAWLRNGGARPGTPQP